MAQKIVSIELPEDSEYVLTKASSLNNNYAMIDIGQQAVGDLVSNPIKLNQRCHVTSSTNWRDTISTSFVKKIILDENNPRKITLETENSIYTLEEIDENK